MDLFRAVLPAGFFTVDERLIADFHNALLQGNRNWIQEHVEQIPELVTWQDSDHNTALHFAVQAGSARSNDLPLQGTGASWREQTSPPEETYLEIIKCLVQKGAPVDRRNNRRETPLHLAVKTGRSAEVVDFLLTKGADPKAFDADGNTALHWAVTAPAHADELTRLLLNKGGFVLLQSWNHDKYTPRDLIATFHLTHPNRRDILEVIDSFAESNLDVIDFFVETKTPEQCLRRLQTMHDELRQNPGAYSPQAQQRLLVDVADKRLKFARLHLGPFGAVLTDELLKPILELANENLLALDLSGCWHLGQTTLETIAKLCPNLQTLVLANLAPPGPSTGQGSNGVSQLVARSGPLTFPEAR